jgi:hypothetical protein
MQAQVRRVRRSLKRIVEELLELEENAHADPEREMLATALDSGRAAVAALAPLAAGGEHHSGQDGGEFLDLTDDELGEEFAAVRMRCHELGRESFRRHVWRRWPARAGGLLDSFNERLEALDTSGADPSRTARIGPMIELLRMAWERFPDQRLGQLIGNAARDPTRVPASDDYRDPFNVGDDELWSGLKMLAEGPGRSGPDEASR